MNSLRVELFENGKSMGSHVVDEKEQVIIGSAKSADFVVPGHNIAGIHALVRVQATRGITVYDLGSQGGTYVGNKRVVEMLLPNGSRFRIGNRELSVSLVQAQAAPELTLFWNRNPRGNTSLHAIYLTQGHIAETDHLATRGSMRLDTEWGTASVKRMRDGNVKIQLPQIVEAEIYQLSGELIERAEAQEFTISPEQKIRLFKKENPNAEIQIFWMGNDLRLARTANEQDNVQGRSFVISFAFFLLFAASLFFLHHAETIPEEALLPKSDYTRVSMDSSAAPAGPAQAQPEAQSEAAASQSQAAPQTPSKPQLAINQMLSKLLQKPDPSQQVKVGLNGEQTARVATVTNSKFSQQAITGGVNSGTVNSQAVSAGLQTIGGGTGKGLNGFAGTGVPGTNTGLGTGQNGMGGFNLNLGTDEAEAIGGLDKALIAAVVQANLGQIKHCYERQLIVDNTLAGKIVAGWTIDGSGSVVLTNIKKTTMNSTPVENCIQGRIKTWKFPQPKGGGKVLVSYPFLFKALN